jgi:hypothetical protein
MQSENKTAVKSSEMVDYISDEKSTDHKVAEKSVTESTKEYAKESNRLTAALYCREPMTTAYRMPPCEKEFDLFQTHRDQAEYISNLSTIYQHTYNLMYNAEDIIYQQNAFAVRFSDLKIEADDMFLDQECFLTNMDRTNVRVTSPYGSVAFYIYAYKSSDEKRFYFHTDPRTLFTSRNVPSTTYLPTYNGYIAAKIDAIVRLICNYSAFEKELFFDLDRDAGTTVQDLVIHSADSFHVRFSYRDVAHKLQFDISCVDKFRTESRLPVLKYIDEKCIIEFLISMYDRGNPHALIAQLIRHNDEFCKLMHGYLDECNNTETCFVFRANNE